MLSNFLSKLYYRDSELFISLIHFLSKTEYQFFNLSMCVTEINDIQKVIFNH